MNYKILEQNGVENANIDGAAFNNFSAGGRSGIVKGVLNECRLFQPASNVLCVSKGEILVHGFRVKLLDDEVFSRGAAPLWDTVYHIGIELSLKDTKEVTMEYFCRPIETLIQDNLFENEEGVYQLEIAQFTHSPDGTIKDVKQTIEVISGPVPGSTGATGKSAYQIAVENGFKGTEKQWLESLKGEAGHSEPAYITEVLATSDSWVLKDSKWQVKIAQSDHNFKKIHSIVVEAKVNGEFYENIVYSYKLYLTGSISIILDKKLDIRIIIKGDK